MRLVLTYRRWCDINETQDIFQALRHSKCLGKIPEESPPLRHKKYYKNQSVNMLLKYPALAKYVAKKQQLFTLC